MNSNPETRSLVCQYLRIFGEFLEPRFLDSLERVAGTLDDARSREATIFIAGNGGSASTGSHWVNDLGKATRRPGKPPVRAISLADNVSWMTALANDEGYDRVFCGQLENLARPGDVFIVISASGNSSNLLEAVALAQARKLTTIALVGFDGGALKSRVDECLWLPSEKGAYGLVESAHSALCHILTSRLATGVAVPATFPIRVAADGR